MTKLAQILVDGISSNTIGELHISIAIYDGCGNGINDYINKWSRGSAPEFLEEVQDGIASAIYSKANGNGDMLSISPEAINLAVEEYFSSTETEEAFDSFLENAMGDTTYPYEYRLVLGTEEFGDVITGPDRCIILD